MEEFQKRKKKSFKNQRSGKRGFASKQSVHELERRTGMAKTRQSLRNLGRSSTVPFLRSPEGPRPGAQLTVREIASTFNGSTGISNLGSVYAGQVIVNSSTPTLFAISFRLDDLQNTSNYSALFDQYRFERVRVHFRSRNNSAILANTASPNAATPTGYIVVDRDDASAPASTGALQQYGNVISLNGFESAYVDLVPSITPSVFSGGAFSGYAVQEADSCWIDIANTGVPVYGVKGGMGGLTLSTSSSWVWEVIPEYIVSFRKTR